MECILAAAIQLYRCLFYRQYDVLSFLIDKKNITCLGLVIGLKFIFLISARTTPFTLGVFTDADEVFRGAGGVSTANTNEASGGAAVGTNEPLGTQGFSIGFAQLPC